MPDDYLSVGARNRKKSIGEPQCPQINQQKCSNRENKSRDALRYEKKINKYDRAEDNCKVGSR